MPNPGVVVIGETPSLASALLELLGIEGIDAVPARTLGEAESLAKSRASTPRPLLITASNGHYSPTVRDWRGSCLRGSDLVIVGTRDPELRSAGQLHVVSLPLVPEEFLSLVRELTAKGRTSGTG